MDDSCAVCAESLEWVAYGACGHREVCSTCVARLRFICNDRRCCICKTENDVVFVTKALGDYTRMINDFSVLPSELREGKVGPYWYHEDTQAFFDDVDHYKMIKAMCRLSCSVCDNVDEQSNDGPRRPRKFRNIEQLRGHLFHQHKLIMCSLCLEGRKVFICEQKLYTRAQLNQHIHTGDSEVDGSESERGGFSGHPSCEFCRNPFYGENELYTHMSTDHYTCHICQRQHPGQYEYFKNYDDLENHFRRDHFLCEDEACLGKKFIVFQSEPELKKHNTIEHAGRMSRAQRNAVLQIPTSFIYRRSNEDNRRGRGRGRGGGRERERGLTFRPEPSDYQLSRAIEASLVETGGEPPSSSSGPVVSDHGDTSIVDSMVQPFESLSTSDSEPPSRYLNAAAHSSRGVPMEESSFPPLAPASSSSQQSVKPSSLKAVSQSSRRVPIEETYFPPLSAAPNTSQQNAKPSSGALPTNTMASHLRRPTNTTVLNSGQARNVNVGNSGQARNVNVLNSGQAWPAVTGRPVQPPSNPVQFRPSMPMTSHGASSVVAPSYASSASKKVPSATVNGWISSGSSSASTGNNTSRISNSASAPTLAGNQPSITSVTDFPPVSATQVRKLPSTISSSKSTSTANVEYVHTANKSLVEMIQAALEYDEEKYSAFKDISGQYRQGLIDTETYLDYVKQYNLSHLLLDLARPLPDPQKQRELIETYNASMRSNGSEDEVGWHGNSRLKNDNGSKKGKGKGKSVALEDGSSKETLADSIISTVRNLQSSYKPSEEETEVLSKDGYRGSRDKSKILSYEQPVEMKTGSKNDSSSTGGKQRKKTSKFDRVRLGDGSVEATFDPKNPDLEPEPLDHQIDSNQNGGLPVRGVWKSKGGQKLFP